MLARKNNNKVYIILLHQMLFIKSLKKFVNRETTCCEALQIKKSKISKFLKDFAQIFFKMLLNSLNTHD